MPQADGASKVSGPPRPTIALPPRSSMMESFFTGAAAGFSPGPMTLVSNFFSDNYPDADYRSFSQLLAGAMGSPIAAVATPKEPIFLADNNLSKEANGSEKEEGVRDLGFRQNRPSNLMVVQSPSMFMVPGGLNSPGLLTPSFFAGLQSPFGMSHQQALAQVTAQAALSQSYNMQIQPEQHQTYTVAPPEDTLTHAQPITTQQVDTVSVMSEPESSAVESSEVFQSERKVAPLSVADKPGSDGYNWRKYGQKQVKASEYPRSYYRCTHPNCRVTKKVERNFEGKITEIIYKGEHNHDLPEPTKRGKSSSDTKPSLSSRASPELSLLGETSMSQSIEVPHSAPGIDQCSAQLTSVPLGGPSNYAETNGIEARVNEDVDEPNLKRRNIEVETTEKSLLHKSVSEPKIVLQTRSEVDLLDDGYKWRKYGQKVVKGNPHPRSYYKCTYTGCHVRKHVERSSTDAKAVITTYEGKHNHDVPVPRKAPNPAPELNPQKVMAKKRGHEEMEFNHDQRHLLLQLKEEQIRV